MLPAEGRNPQVIGRNGPTYFFQLQSDRSVVLRGFLLDLQHRHRGDPIPKPALVTGPVPGLRDSKPIFTKDNDRNRQTFGGNNNFKGCGITVCSG